MRKLICLLLTLFAVPALAADATVTWTNPTANTDGSAIPATGAGSLTGTRVEWGTCSGTSFGTKAGEVTAAAGATSTVVANLVPGTWCFRAFSRNTYGSESVASNVAVKVVPVPVPNPPTVVTVTTLAYDLTRSGSIGRIVGRVDLGTECVGGVIKTWKDGTTWYEVPRDDVTITRTPRSEKIVSKCAAAT